MRRARSRAGRPWCARSRSAPGSCSTWRSRSASLHPSSGGHERGDLGRGGRRRVASEEAGPRAPGEHVVDGAGHLGSHRVHDLGLRVGETGHDRLGQRRVGARAARALRGRRRRSASRDRPAARPRPIPPRRAAARAWCGSGAGPSMPSSFTATSIVSAAIRRYVVSLPPVTVITPPADERTECRRERSAVRSLFAARHERAQPGPRAEDVGLGDRRGDRAVDRAQEVLDVVGCDLRVVDRVRRSRCRWCRCR